MARGVATSIATIACFPVTTLAVAARPIGVAPAPAGDRAIPSAMTGTLRRAGGEAGAGGRAEPIAVWQR